MLKVSSQVCWNRQHKFIFILKTRFYIYKLLTWVTLLNHAESVCFKSVIQSGHSLFLSKIKKKYIAKITCGCFPTSIRIFTYKSEIFRHKTSHIVLSIIFLEDKHKILLHLSIFDEYQQFFQHRICFSIQLPNNSDPWPRLARSTSFFIIMLLNNVVLSR